MEFGLRQTVWLRHEDKWQQGSIVYVLNDGEMFEVNIYGCLDDQGNMTRTSSSFVKVAKNELFCSNPVTR